MLDRCQENACEISSSFIENYQLFAAGYIRQNGEKWKFAFGMLPLGILVDCALVLLRLEFP